MRARLVSLEVGPSEVSAEVVRDVAEIAESGLLSASHRGPRVSDTVREAVRALRDALAVPSDMAVLFQPSATAAMDTILRNLVPATPVHFVHGAFSQRFATTAAEIGLSPRVHETPWDVPPRTREAEVPAEAELLAVTHNETSTGMAWPWNEVRALREAHPRPLLALDVTSSIASMAMEWTLADVWFGSVQKGFGLPAGLGLLLVGPRALERARERGARRRIAAWQDLLAMAAKIEDGQTVETPNVLALALLARQMRRWNLPAVDAATREKARRVAALAGEGRFFVREARWRSITTHCLLVPSPDECVRRARDAGYAVGRGYGPLRTRSIRVGTFPSVPPESVDAALRALFPGGPVSDREPEPAPAPSSP